MEVFLNIMIFVLGLCVGSFVNMLTYRTAVRYKLESRKFKVKSEGRSYCDFCGRQLKWYENIPVISWVIQRGKSRCCANPLPWEYPIVEVGMGILFLITNYELRITNWGQLIIILVVVTLLVFSAVFDFKYMILPDFSNYLLIGVAFLGVMFDEKNIIPYLLVAAGSFGFLLFLHMITKGRGMGMGDVKFAIFMGLFLGWPKVVVAFYVAFIVGAVIGVVLMITKKVNRKTQIAFGPFLIGGTVLAYLFGDSLLYYVYRWF